jgi:ribosomal protein S18 acetylase RimI-like enzyme
MLEVRALTAEEARQCIPVLAKILVDCVAGGASVSFMAGFSQSDGEAYFHRWVDEVERGERIILAAFLQAQLVGSVQIILATPPNQPHRADVAKLIVSPSVRGQGIATKLMQAVEEESRRAGRTILVLDTVTGSTADRLYTKLGWNRVGEIPKYALDPAGNFCPTTYFWKEV